MPLTIRPYSTVLNQLITILTNSTQKITNLKSGSVALALLQAMAGNTMALQQLISHVYAVARLGTSFGTDVDSFCADFGVLRSPAKNATTTVRLRRGQGNGILNVVPGSLVQTSVNQVQFSVIADISQSKYNAVAGTYQFLYADPYIDVTVQALVAGTGSNVAAHSINQIVSGLVGISSVDNSAGVTNGADIETDAALKQRFVSFLIGLSKATGSSIADAILAVQPGVTYQIIEYEHFNGTPFVAGFTVVVDDGTGMGNTPFLNAVKAAVDTNRGLGIRFEVYAPTNVAINAGLTLSVPVGTSVSVAQANVIAAFNAYIKSLGVGVNVNYADFVHVVEGVSGVYAVTASSLNGVSADTTILATQIAQPGTITFS